MLDNWNWYILSAFKHLYELLWKCFWDYKTMVCNMPFDAMISDFACLILQHCPKFINKTVKCQMRVIFKGSVDKKVFWDGLSDIWHYTQIVVLLKTFNCSWIWTTISVGYCSCVWKFHLITCNTTRYICLFYFILFSL